MVKKRVCPFLGVPGSIDSDVRRVHIIHEEAGFPGVSLAFLPRESMRIAPPFAASRDAWLDSKPDCRHTVECALIIVADVLKIRFELRCTTGGWLILGIRLGEDCVSTISARSN